VLLAAARPLLADTPAEQPLTGDPAPDSRWPMLVGAQYTFVDQKQTALTSPYQGKLSLHPEGDRQTSNTIGFYAGWAPLHWLQLYLDTEKFMGAAVSNATGVGNLTNGDVVHAGSGGLKKEFYIARSYVRLMLPLGCSPSAGSSRASSALRTRSPAPRRRRGSSSRRAGWRSTMTWTRTATRTPPARSS
jgi:hypothetical protein